MKKREKKVKKTSNKKSGLRRKNIGLTKSLMIRIVLMVVVALFLLGSIENEIARRISQERITDLSEQAVDDYSKLVESELSTLQAYVYMMSYSSGLDEARPVEELAMVRDTYVSQFKIGNIFFVNADGTVFDSPSTNVSGKEYFKRALSDGYYISSPALSDNSGKHVIYISAPILNGNWNGGVIVVELDLDILDNVVADMSVAGSGEGYIFDSEGNIVASKNRELVEAEANFIKLAEVDESYSIYANAVKEALANESGVYTQSKYAGAYKAIEGTDGWKIAVTADKSDLNTLYTTAGATSAVILLIAIIVSIFLTLRIVKSVVKPTNKIITRLDSLKEGDLSQHEVPDLHYKEMNQLGNSLSETIGNLRNYVGEISETLSSISDNNLDVEITQEYVGDFAEIKNSLLGITDSLNATIRRIDSVSRDVLAASEQVSSSSQLLAQGATEQAGTLDELVTEIEGVSKKIAETAVVAGEANGKTEEVKNEIVKSNEKMQELSAAMADIDDTSRQVAKVVKMIEDIAFQTNILALNAAVEAARAGQSGRGFAVVANEVKNLASKSAEAAGDTTKLISNTIEAVKKGMDLSGETAEILSGVVESVDDVTKIVSDISVASKEESGAIERVVVGLDQVSVVVQSNSATAEESSALSAELETNAKKLQDLVAEFQLKED